MEFKYIEKNPNICGGKPIFKGTRIPIYIVLDLLSAGESIDSILNNYPQLNRKAILEAIKYASKLTRLEEEFIEITN